MTNISIYKLHEFRDHPYQVLDNDEMNSLIESVQQQGIMTPLIVRPLEGTTDEYEIISGHRRFRAAQKAGLAEVPAFIRPVSRDEAAIMVVDSNLHREHLLPSEKAFAYKLKADALNHQGKRNDLTSGQIVSKSDDRRTTATIGEKSGESYKTVQRYIRLTNLIPELLELMDEGKIAFSVGVELSYLSINMQFYLLDIIERDDCTPSYSQAFHMHKEMHNGTLTMQYVDKLMATENGVRVLSARENITDDASGILVEGVLESMAEYFSAELSQKIHRGMEINAQKCLSNGSNYHLTCCRLVCGQRACLSRTLYRLVIL